MIEQFTPRLMQSSSREQPLVLAHERAYLDCGCSGFIGTRVDNRQEVTVLRACAKHDSMMATVHERLVAALREAKPVSLVQLVDRLLRETA